MDRSRGLAFVLLCIASLTLALCAGAAWFRAGSANGAFAFGLAAFTLVPPLQQLIGNLTHKLLPARLAFIATLTLVPLGTMFVAIDGVTILDAAAKQRGFASAGQMARARDLGLATPAALAAYDEARHRSALEKQCRAEAAKLKSKLISCPYHGWSYSVDGSLVDTPGELFGVPHFKAGYDGRLDRSQWGLVRVAQMVGRLLDQRIDRDAHIAVGNDSDLHLGAEGDAIDLLLDRAGVGIDQDA